MLVGYLPQALTEAELTAAIDAVVRELGATSLKDMGRVMQAVLEAHKGQVDGKKASELVRARLSS